MELIDRLKKIMEQEFSITTDEQLMQAVENMSGIDLGIFTATIQEVKQSA